MMRDLRIKRPSSPRIVRVRRGGVRPEPCPWEESVEQRGHLGHRPRVRPAHPLPGARDPAAAAPPAGGGAGGGGGDAAAAAAHLLVAARWRLRVLLAQQLWDSE